MRGTDIQKVHHAFGTNGIITELELTLKPALDWLHTITLFDSYGDALRFCKAASAPELDLFLLTSVEKGFAPFYEHLGARFPADRNAVFAMVSPASIDPLSRTCHGPWWSGIALHEWERARSERTSARL